MTDQNSEMSNSDIDAWGTTEFQPGADVGLVARRTVGLIARDNPSTRRRLWEFVSRDAPLDDILDELSSTGLKALPDFGVAQAEGSGVRIVARGRALVDVELDGGEHHQIDATDVRTWIEEVLTDVVSVTISLSPAGDDRGLDTSENDVFAVLAGSVPAAALTRRFDRADPHAAEAMGGSGWMASGFSEAPDDALPDVEPDAPVDAVDPDEGAEVDEPEVPSDDGESDVDADPPDSLFEHTPSGPGTGAPPPAAPPPPAPPSDLPPSASADVVSTGPPVSSTVVIGDDVGQPPPPVPNPPAPDAPETDDTPEPAAMTHTFAADHDGMTMGPGELAALQAEAGEAAPPDAPDGGRVHAVLAFSNGVRIDVDRTVLIGRNPKVSGSVGNDLPRLMKFDGPGQGLSRTHAEVRIDDSQLVLEDLQSTNGTEVQLPGQPRQRVRSGEPVVLVPGSLIDFGDELHCTVEAPA